MATAYPRTPRAARSGPASVIPQTETADLERRICAWEHGMIAVLDSLSEAQSDDRHAQFAPH
jgi:hypothetical protein